MKQKFNNCIMILFFILLCTGCNDAGTEEYSAIVQKEIIDIGKWGNEAVYCAVMERESTGALEADEKVEEEIIKTYSYDVECANPSWLQDDYQKLGVNEMPIMQVENRLDEAWTLRINKLLVERSLEVLPKEQEWLSTAEVRITYRSENYLCFEYISHAPLPEEYDSTLLNFTLDLKREQWVEYPEKDGNDYEETLWHEERRRYMEKSVEEQGRMHGESGYEVYEKKIESDTAAIPAIQVRGLADERMQEQINSILEEPLEALLSYQWSDGESVEEELKDTKCYIAYKTPEWLSVVYFIPTEPYFWTYFNGNIEFGVTINMQTGERYMLDDLFEFNSLEEWWILNCRNTLVQRATERAWMGGSVLKEHEILSESTEFSDFYSFASEWRSFYLTSGRVVFEYWGGSTSCVLPDIYEYLKVDPWY